MSQDQLIPEVKAIVDGKELTQLPDDLFIPPDALEVLLDSFSGPLDLLLYLIRKQNIDILNIPMTSIIKQYLHYIQLMEQRRMELASDYLLMAAMLIEIKSRLLLPSIPDEEEDEEDPRMVLVRRLQAYEQIKEAAQLLDALPRQDREHFIIHIMPDELITTIVHPEVSLLDLAHAFHAITLTEERRAHHQIEREVLSVRERMNAVLTQLQYQKVCSFTSLYRREEGRMGLIVSFLAILELARQSLLMMTQTHAFAPIYLQAIPDDE